MFMKYVQENQLLEKTYFEDRPKIRIAFVNALNDLFRLSIIHQDHDYVQQRDLIF